jgi:hypothetical protein
MPAERISTRLNIRQCLAVNPANPLQIAASAFTRGHDGTERRPAHLPDGLLPKGLRLLRGGVLLISQKI